MKAESHLSGEFSAEEAENDLGCDDLDIYLI